MPLKAYLVVQEELEAKEEVLFSVLEGQLEGA